VAQPVPSAVVRVLLAAGGLTLFGFWAADPVDDGTVAPRVQDARRVGAVTDGGRPARGTPASARPAQPHPAGTEPGRQQLAVARRGEMPLRTIDDGSKAIALTIDDGPNPVYTPQVLALLARYRVTATFSMIGMEAQAHPAVAREVAAAGHLIANRRRPLPDGGRPEDRHCPPAGRRLPLPRPVASRPTRGTYLRGS
jgi:peptidoglycan-N-acetylglucosamine deacetylase